MNLYKGKKFPHPLRFLFVMREPTGNVGNPTVGPYKPDCAPLSNENHFSATQRDG